MDKFLVKRPRSSIDECGSSSQQQQQQEPFVEVNLDTLPSDPGLRRKIATYHPNDQDKIWRAYLQKGPCQPKNHNFPQRNIGGAKRRFSPAWFTEFGNWLEYSIEKDAAYCLHCYLFRPDIGNQAGGDTFVTEGFNSWNKKDKIKSHVGPPNSAHNIAFRKCQDLMNQNQHIDTVMSRHSDKVRDIYRTRLKATIELSQALQRKDQDILNAMNLVNITKDRFETLRNDGWDFLLQEVISFCNKNSITVPAMEDLFVKGQSVRNPRGITAEHHYRVELFYTVIDMQLQELNDRFGEINTQLLLCLASLDPSKLFSAFDKAKLLEFASFYPDEFSPFKLAVLNDQLDCYIVDMRRNVQFASLKGLQQLSETLVENGRHNVYPEVFLLLKLALVLPVATATVERAFSAMNIVKNRLRNQMGIHG